MHSVVWQQTTHKNHVNSALGSKAPKSDPLVRAGNCGAASRSCEAHANFRVPTRRRQCAQDVHFCRKQSGGPIPSLLVPVEVINKLDLY